MNYNSITGIYIKLFSSGMRTWSYKSSGLDKTIRATMMFIQPSIRGGDYTPTKSQRCTIPVLQLCEWIDVFDDNEPNL